MNINQRITLEDKKRLEKFTVVLINISSVINLIINAVVIVLLIQALYYVLKAFDKNEIDPIWIFLLIALDVVFSFSRKSWKRQKSCRYIKNLDKNLSVTEDIPYYDIKADDAAVTVNDTYTLKWKDVYAASFTKEFVVLSSKSKCAVMIQADDELKEEIAEFLKNNKIFTHYLVKTPVNKKAIKHTVVRNRKKMIKNIIIYVVIASLPIAYLMTAKSPVKDLTTDNSNPVVMPSEDKNKDENTQGITATEQNGVMVVKISTAEDIVKMSADYAVNGQKYKNYRFVLTNDIDMSKVKNFMPIGIYNTQNTDILSIEEYGFCSEFDGQGYTISNLNINYDCKEITMNNQPQVQVGLFSKISRNGAVKNLNITNANVTYTTDDEAMYPSAMGILAGMCEGKITQCNVQGDVNGVMMVGGIAGQVYENGIVDCCHSQATVKGSNELGCLVGNLSFGTIVHSSAEGVVIGVQNSYMDNHVFNEKVTPYAVGGLVARIHCASVEGSHSDVELQIEGKGKTIGSFAGYCQSSNIKNCTYNSRKTDERKAVSYHHNGYEEGITYTYELEAVE